MWLGAWEGMASRLARGWPPDGWYPAEYYREDLQVRDDLEAVVGTLPDAVRDEAVGALAAVDARIVGLTDDDAGRALATATGALTSGEWWWRRIPHPLPWRDAPG